MRFALDGEQRRFFEKEGKIAFAELINSQQVASLLGAINTTLAHRFKIRHEELTTRTQEQIVRKGRDLFRDNGTVKKAVANRAFAQLAAELFLTEPLRLAYDQLLLPEQAKENRRNPYPEVATLSEVSSFQGIVGGMLLCLEGDQSEHDFFPTIPGDALFVRADLEIPFEELREMSKRGRYLLIVFGADRLIYAHKESDPNGHTLKDLDFVFGDRLKEATHPTLLQRL